MKSKGQDTQRKRICVIGAGTAGLVATKVALEEGQGAEVVCFERAAGLGGIWWYRPHEVEQTTVMEFTVTNTSKEMSAFSDFPPSEDLPPYLPHREMLSYLRGYAKHFGVNDVIRFNIDVQKVNKLENGRWRVEVCDHRSGSTSAEEFDAVIVCIGHHSIPRLPHYTGQELFQGRIIHAKLYKNTDGYRGKRVLVVGFGNSAADVATSLAGIAEQVYISVRRGTWMYSSHTGGVPSDFAHYTRFNRCLPPALCSFLLYRYVQGWFNHDLIGFTPLHSADSQMGTMNDFLPRALLSSQIRLKPPIELFRENGVVFEGCGECVPIDEVIMATGYLPDVPFVDPKYYGKASLKGDVERLMLFKGIYSICDDSIGFVGMIDAIGNLGQLFEMQARHFMAVYSGRTRLPPAKEARMTGIAQSIAKATASFVGGSDRHAIMVDKMRYMDDLAKDIGAKPKWWKLFVRDPYLALKCFVGPLLPYQYRLVGPYSWPGAREAIMSAWTRQVASLRPTPSLPRTTVASGAPDPYTLRYAMFAVLALLLAMIAFISPILWAVSS